MRRFMDPQHQMAYWSEHPRAGTFQRWKSLRCWSMIFEPSSGICADCRSDKLVSAWSLWRPSTLTRRFSEEAGLAQGEVRRDRCGARVGYSQHPVLSIKTVFVQQHR